MISIFLATEHLNLSKFRLCVCFWEHTTNQPSTKLNKVSENNEKGECKENDSQWT